MLIPWLVVVKCKISRMLQSLRSHTSAQPGIPVQWHYNPSSTFLLQHQSFALIRPAMTKQSHYVILHRCATLRQKLVETQLVWLWWTPLWMSCRVDVSPLTSSLRVYSRRPQTVLWVWDETNTYYILSVSTDTYKYLNMDNDPVCCHCQGLHRRCMWFKHQHRNLQSAPPFLHWKDNAGVSGIRLSFPVSLSLAPKLLNQYSFI